MESTAAAIRIPGTVAYFSLEIALENSISTYGGGLGILAGDTVRSAADLGVDLVAITLVHRRGRFLQHVDAQGHQSEEPGSWPVEDFLEACAERAEVQLGGRTVHLRAWRYDVRGLTGHVVPVYLLDSDLPENDPGVHAAGYHLVLPETLLAKATVYQYYYYLSTLKPEEVKRVLDIIDHPVEVSVKKVE